MEKLNKIEVLVTEAIAESVGLDFKDKAIPAGLQRVMAALMHAKARAITRALSGKPKDKPKAGSK